MKHARTVSEMRNVTKFAITFERGYMYFGTYTFLIKEAFPTIADIAFVVASLKKLKITCPLNKYNGKFSISNRNKFENTTDRTAIIRRGFNNVHSTPNTERRYLIFTSLDTSSSRSGLYFKKF
jgi:hypothetical protein